jgi:hypothetical protein
MWKLPLFLGKFNRKCGIDFGGQGIQLLEKQEKQGGGLAGSPLSRPRMSVITEDPSLAAGLDTFMCLVGAVFVGKLRAFQENKCVEITPGQFLQFRSNALTDLWLSGQAEQHPAFSFARMLSGAASKCMCHTCFPQNHTTLQTLRA